MRALVTGGQGFVGSHLCERLVAQGHCVRVLARPSSGLQACLRHRGRSRSGRRDRACGPAVGGGRLRRRVPRGRGSRGLREQDLFQVNADGTRNLVGAAVAAAPRLARFVYVSSLAAAGPSPGGSTPRTEEMPPKPLTWYGRSKLAGESAVRSVAGLNWTIVRPPIVFGPRERDVLRYFRLARRGCLPVVGFSDRYYSLIYVEDLAEGLLRAAEAPAAVGQVLPRRARGCQLGETRPADRHGARCCGPAAAPAGDGRDRRRDSCGFARPCPRDPRHLQLAEGKRDAGAGMGLQRRQGWARLRLAGDDAPSRRVGPDGALVP